LNKAEVVECQDHNFLSGVSMEENNPLQGKAVEDGKKGTSRYVNKRIIPTKKAARRRRGGESNGVAG